MSTKRSIEEVNKTVHDLDQVNKKSLISHNVLMNILNEIGTIHRMNPKLLGEVGSKVEKLNAILVMVGDQSVGKTSLFNRLCEIMMPEEEVGLETGIGRTTEFPIEFRFRHESPKHNFEIMHNSSVQHFKSRQEMIQKGKELAKTDLNGEILMIVYHQIPKNFDEFTMVDLPGLCENMESEKAYLSKKYNKLVTSYAIKPNSIMIHLVNFVDDISNSTSIKVLKEKKEEIKAKHVIVATKIDRVENSELITINLQILNDNFGETETFFCVPSEKDLEQERKIIIDKIGEIGENPVYHCGTEKLNEALPKFLRNFFQDQLPVLTPKINELEKYCMKQLEGLGYEPPSVHDLAHKWSNKYNSLIKDLFLIKRIEINRLLDEHTSDKGEDYLELMDISENTDENKIKEKITEAIEGRGDSLKELVSLDIPIREIIKEKCKSMMDIYIKFNDKLNKEIKSLIEKTTTSLREKFPQCEQMNSRLILIINRIINEKKSKFKQKIINFINETHQNPTDYFNGKSIFCRAMFKAGLKKYKDAFKTKEIVIENAMKWADNSNSWSDIGDIQVDIVNQYIEDLMHEIIHNYFSNIITHVKTLSCDLAESLTGSFMIGLITNAKKLIHESYDVQNQRKMTLKVLELTKVFGAYN